MSGSAEIAPHLGIADIVVDLTSTGSTLRMNGLREVATVLDSSARLIASPGLAGIGGNRTSAAFADASPSLGRTTMAAGLATEAPAAVATPPQTASNAAKSAALGELVAALTSVLRARGQRYLMANVPRAALERVKRVLPGLNGPTVVDVLDGGEVVAVH